MQLFGVMPAAYLVGRGNKVLAVQRTFGFWMMGAGTGLLVWLVPEAIRTSLSIGGIVPIITDPGSLARTIAGLVTSFVGLATANIAMNRARRWNTGTIADPGDLSGMNHMLYLRSFRDDGPLNRFLPLHPARLAASCVFVEPMPEEAQVVLSLVGDERICPVGVAPPGEQADFHGAYRLYLAEGDWKPQVRKLMKEASHVVLVLGTTEGTLWELRTAMKELPPERLILVVPWKIDEYLRYRALGPSVFGFELPPYPFASGLGFAYPYERRGFSSTTQGLIVFAKDWTPVMLPLRHYGFFNSFETAMEVAAWPPMRRLGFRPQGLARIAPNAPYYPARSV
ncbi:hypothetical protein [Promicromonospora panici]|uniref:hypothetical protein n=1 Tax=Promicromonospora panici TaxID=2219658 RepID=UPI00101DB34F|nr:hypothetical protein [Promicromonospora panici]